MYWSEISKMKCDQNNNFLWPEYIFAIVSFIYVLYYYIIYTTIPAIQVSPHTPDCYYCISLSINPSVYLSHLTIY